MILFFFFLSFYCRFIIIDCILRFALNRMKIDTTSDLFIITDKQSVKDNTKIQLE